MKPVDIYVRVSRKGARADDRFHSPEEQEALARAFIERRGLPLGIVLQPDIDRSGGTVEREGLRQALERIRAGESSGFAVAWLDRFSRDAAQAYELLAEIEAAGGRVWAPEAPEDMASPEGEMQLGVLLLVSQYQRKRARAGFERAKARATRSGIPVGRVPVGYRARPDRTLEADPGLAPVIAELFERRAAGDGWTTLARWLADVTGHPWTRQGVAGIVGRRLYATGRLEYEGVESEVDAGALVDWPTWQAAQRPGRRPRVGGRWLLSGLLRCDTCGRAMAPWRASQSKGGGRRYRCPGWNVCPGRASVDAERIERIVVGRVLSVAGALLASSPATEDLAPLEAALDRAQARLDQALAPEAQDALGETWPATVKARRAALEEAATELGRARLVTPTDGRPLSLAQVWPDLSPAQQREALSWYLEEVRLAPVPRGAERGPEDTVFVERVTRPWRPQLELEPWGFGEPEDGTRRDAQPPSAR